MVPEAQSGWQGRTGWALVLAAGIGAALCGVSSAQDCEASRGDHRREVYVGDNRGYHAPGHLHGCCGGPYKGFYPCNCATPYNGGACNVYGDAPIYSAPADYGSHCALWCR